jgi:hypothetical protein
MNGYSWNDPEKDEIATWEEKVQKKKDSSLKPPIVALDLKDLNYLTVLFETNWIVPFETISILCQQHAWAGKRDNV